MKSLQRSYELPQQILEQNCPSGPFSKDAHKFKNHHKILTIILIFGIFITYRLLHSSPVNRNCVVDNMHQWTFGLNRWIAANCARPFIGLGQVIMDISITCMLIHWMLSVKTFRVLLVAAFFQYSRQLVLKLVTMPFEAYTVWYSPGFPTWTIEYGHTSDYFFSGHTGTVVILYLQAKKLNLPFAVQLLLILSTFYIISMLLIARVHYTVDVFGGVFFAAFCYQMADRHLQLLDRVVNSPYRVFEILKQRVKRKLQLDENEGTSLFDIQHE